ncbi:MotA/TolQ/ExbB proton channel family protein [Campylobacter sp. MIT 21-1685]|uniref:MotA/TolQ/ExbB proton channel family protein n=1 Tax=unclassified Campylobacter TaxID=2593542 RepID=UPI00224ADE58|nr:MULTISPECIES: MotA/TolQ/ExbB proton channel family protein [unclassified Campylobacter]MCX2682347.1 MotA/TolQ/ExbB proton channel family protein [Campylobacter sp. MIT 21-1684]MCX2750627.1 MotA/TolQ/ExbB proton channel family protein [Campylobacter sp. MIT 21-1682]MCX2806825.1 MotA/TolQ/ExbB proton channel family protein [Campylobacter sp. MIT 21-1685]
MEIKSEEISELILPEIKERKSFFVYFKIIFFPAFLYFLVLLVYFGYFDYKIPIHSVLLMGVIFLTALIFARHSAEYAFSIFEQQKDEFKQALKSYIMKHFLTIGKYTKSNAKFDDFASLYIKNVRNENFASIGSTIFPMMGILGTFISIAFSMPHFNSNDTEGLETEIAILLNGVATAFYVSIYGIFLALWWMFFEKYGTSKMMRLLNRQKISTTAFFWTKEELDQRYLSKSLQHFENIGAIFKQVSNKDFFTELDHAIERKFALFQDMLNVEEKAVRLSSEYVKQTMGELSKAQREHRDIGKLYSEMLNAVGNLNHSFRDLNIKMSEQYNRLLDVSSNTIGHLDKTLASFDQKVVMFMDTLRLHEKALLENQQRMFEGFKSSIFEGMQQFKEVYTEEKSIDEKIEMMQGFRNELEQLQEQTNELVKKFDNEEIQRSKTETPQNENKENE